MAEHYKTKDSHLADFVEYISCDLCGSREVRALYPSTFGVQDFSFHPSKSFMYASPDKARGGIVKCVRCGLVYMSPRDRDITNIYTSVGEDVYYLSSQGDRLLTCERDYGALEAVVGKADGRRVLDVGCSYGLFMDVCKRHGWDVYGTELSKLQFLSAAQRHPHTWNAELQNCGFADSFFHLVTLYDVVEHLPSPYEFLREAQRVLKPEGYLVLCTPDQSSVPARLFGKRWLNYARMHLYYFTPRTLTRLLEQSGFQVVRIARHKRVIRLGVAIEWMRKHPFIYRVLNFALGNSLMKDIRLLSSMSGNMVVYAQKQ